MNGKRIEGLVTDDGERGLFRVNRQAFVSPELLSLEHREIYGKCWLYACHRSEFSGPGSFVTRKVGGRALLIVRDAAGEIRAFFNACTHRGNLVSREKSGTTRAFSCFYHAWSFNLHGELIGVPGDDAYTAAFDRKELGLRAVPRFAEYRGLLFVNFDPQAASLESYLGNACEFIDAMIDFAGGEVEIVEGAQNYSMRANWKLLVENSMDGYHALSTHARYFRQYMPDMGLDSTQWLDLRGEANADTTGVALDNGHAVISIPMRPTPLSASAKEELTRIRHGLDARFGKERAHQIADFHRNLFIFPNLILISLWRTIRTFYPVAPDYMEIDAWGLLPRNESAELRQKRYSNFLSFLGPGGFATPDDVAALEGCQRGFAAQPEAWSDISRGMGRAPLAIDELQMRAFWRRWHALMAGARGVSGYGDRRAEAIAAVNGELN